MMRHAAVALALLSLSGCSKASAKPFVGTWDCESSLTLHYEVPSGKPDKSSKTTSTVTVVAEGGGISASSPGCSLTYVMDGTTAVENKGQVCSVDDVVLKVASGTMNVDGNTMTSITTYSFTKNSAGVSIKSSGSASGTGTCKRK